MAAKLPMKFPSLDEGEAKQTIIWDPSNSSDWDKVKPSGETVARIKRDLDGVFSDPPHGVFVIPDGSNIMKLRVLITGPFDTPYEGGFFQFLLRYPPEYPHRPPRVRFLTTGRGTVRFNPNLYANGKVCLSILGTWPGPQWSAAQNLRSVVLSIQSLLSDNPFFNEPGFNKEIIKGDVENYNNVVRHETLRVAVCDTLEGDDSPEDVREVMKSSFKVYYDYYISTARESADKLDGQTMQDPFTAYCGRRFNFRQIVRRLEKLRSLLSDN